MNTDEYMKAFKYKATRGNSWWHTLLLRVFDGWKVAMRGSCNEYSLSVAFMEAGGWLVFWLNVFTGYTVFWLCWTNHWYPSHVVLWQKGRDRGWTDSSFRGWRKKFGVYNGFNGIRCIPLTLGPIPYLALAVLVVTDHDLLLLEVGAVIWCLWVPVRVFIGLFGNREEVL